MHAREEAERYAPLPDPILLFGPTGSGKGLLAKTMHARSGRRGDFVHLTGGQLVDTLYQSQLFGYAKGAYTGATQDSPGAFVQAERGTLFLDELPLWSRAAQAAVLQAVEEGWVLPVGARRPIPVSCRILFGSNRRLEDLAVDGRLMEDLLYRIGDFVIELPPLAKRRVDIAVLAYHYLEEQLRAGPASGPVLFTPDAFGHLLAYGWPGNVRELKNAVRFACVQAAGLERIGVDHLPRQVRAERGAVDAQTLREVTAWVLERNGRNRRAAARQLGVHPNTVDYRLRRAMA